MSKPSSHLNVLPDGYKLHWYTISRVLGRGGFGITYLAHDDNLNTDVAIKEFLPSTLALRDDEGVVTPLSDSQADTYKWGLARFLDEARTLAKFRHPNIVLVHSVFEANNTAYIVMEYQRGENLESAYRAGRFTTADELQSLLYPLMDGVEVVHQAGFVHRDIKPANIYLKDDNSPVLLDFGSARQALGMETQTLTAMVSPGYAPFEQYNANTDSDNQGPWTDIYALGCSIYRGIAGKSHADALMLARDRIEGRTQVETPASAAGEGRFDSRFLHGIDQAMRFSAEDRPQSIAQWREILGAPAVPAAKTPVGERNTAPGSAPTEPVSQDNVETVLTNPTEHRVTQPPCPPAPTPAPAIESGANAAAAANPTTTDSAAPSKSGIPWFVWPAAAVVLLGAGFALLGGDDADPTDTQTPTTQTTPAPTTPAPAAATLDAAAVTTLVDGTSCAKLAFDGRSITGVAGDKALAGIKQSLSAMAAGDTVRVSGIQSYADAYCGVIDTLGPSFSGSGNDTLPLVTSKADNAFVEGERLVIQTQPNVFDKQYVYIDYFTLDGSVVHLLSEASEQSYEVARNSISILGEEGDIERWDVAPPFGDEMISVVVSNQPLFSDRKNTDAQDTKTYVGELRSRIEAVTSIGGKVAANHVRISTRAR